MFSYQLSKKRDGFQNKKDHSFRISRLLGDPFGLTTLSLCIVSFIVALAGSVAATASSEDFPEFTWWGLAYQFALLIVIFFFYCHDLIEYYRIFLTASLGVSLVYNTNSTTNLIYAQGPRKAAASAGYIMLSMVNLIWIFYFGSDNGSPINQKIDSYSLTGVKPSNVVADYIQDRRYSSLNRTSRSNYRNSYAENSQRHTSFQAPPAQQQSLHNQSTYLQNNNSNNNNSNYSQHQQPENNYVSSTALNGFENIDASNNSTPQFGNTLNRLQNDPMEYSNENTHNTENTNLTDPNNGNTASTNNSKFVNPATQRAIKSKSSITDSTASASMGLYSDMGEELSQFPYRARALYSYEADPSDAYEISFNEGEILSVADIEGRWWSCRKDSGERGIIPSNYVELIES